MNGIKILIAKNDWVATGHMSMHLTYVVNGGTSWGVGCFDQYQDQNTKETESKERRGYERKKKRRGACRGEGNCVYEICERFTEKKMLVCNERLL